MKRLIGLVLLLLLVSCASTGQKYTRTEGPFRGKFAGPYSIHYINQGPWEMPLFFDGVLPNFPVHVEGHLINNGTEYLQYHADLPEIRRRTFRVRNKFTMNNYCEAVGKPLDRFDADQAFWNKGQQGIQPGNMPPLVIEDEATGEVELRFVFWTLEQEEDGHGEWKRDKILAQMKTRVKLECPMCGCGGNLV